MKRKQAREQELSQDSLADFIVEDSDGECYSHLHHTALCVEAGPNCSRGRESGLGLVTCGPSGDTQSSEWYADSDVESGASSEDAWVDSEGAVVVGVCG